MEKAKGGEGGKRPIPELAPPRKESFFFSLEYTRQTRGEALSPWELDGVFEWDDRSGFAPPIPRRFLLPLRDLT